MSRHHISRPMIRNLWMFMTLLNCCLPHYHGSNKKTLWSRFGESFPRQDPWIGHPPNTCRLSYLLCPKSEKISLYPKWLSILKHAIAISQVKCDKKTGECGNCARLRLVCSGHTTPVRSQTTGDETDQGDSRRGRRMYWSCTACRASKTKCSGERPCQRCRWKCSNECVYAESTQPTWVRRVNVTPIDKGDFSPSLPSMPERSFDQTTSNPLA